jgi:hypothetical protein
MAASCDPADARPGLKSDERLLSMKRLESALETRRRRYGYCGVGPKGDSNHPRFAIPHNDLRETGMSG